MSKFKRLNDDGRRNADEESDDGDVSIYIRTVHISLRNQTEKKKTQSRFTKIEI